MVHLTPLTDAGADSNSKSNKASSSAGSSASSSKQNKSRKDNTGKGKNKGDRVPLPQARPAPSSNAQAAPPPPTPTPSQGKADGDTQSGKPSGPRTDPKPLKAVPEVEDVKLETAKPAVKPPTGQKPSGPKTDPKPPKATPDAEEVKSETAKPAVKPPTGQNKGPKPAKAGKGPQPAKTEKAEAVPKPDPPKGKGKDGKKDPKEATPTGPVDPEAGKVEFRKPFRVTNNFAYHMLDSNAYPDMWRHFPGVVVAKATRGVNEHTVLHHTRVFMEQDVFEALFHQKITSVVDVGGMAVRAGKLATKLKIKYHAACPTIDSTDMSRTKYRADNTCGSKISDCAHFSGVEAVVAIHSLYYLTPEEWAAVLVRTTRGIGHAVVHEFLCDRGTFPVGLEGVKPEAHYTVLDGIVEMKVNGNNHAYNHCDMRWLAVEAGRHMTIGGEKFTLGWTLRKRVAGTVWYEFSIAKGHLTLAKPNVPVIEAVTVAPSILTLMRVTSYKMEGGFLNLMPKNGAPHLIHIGLLKAAKLGAIGKMPTASAYQQMLSNTRLLSRDPKIVDVVTLDRLDFSRIIMHTATLAFLQNAVDLNQSQRDLQEYEDLLTNVAYLSPVARSRFGDSLFGQLLTKVENVAIRLGCEVPYRYVEDAAVVVANTPKSIAVGAGTQVFRLTVKVVKIELKVLCFVLNTFVSVVGKAAPGGYTWAKAYLVKSTKRVTSVASVAYSVDPAIIQREIDSRIVAYVKDNKATQALLEANLHSSADAIQDIKHKGCFKELTPVVIPPNELKAAGLPYIVTEYAGPTNAPSASSTSTKYSALLFRLLGGQEHSSAKQVHWEKRVLKEMRETGYLPNSKWIDAWNADHPQKTPREWLAEDYGRRQDKGMVEKLTKAIERLEQGEEPTFSVEWFTKTENAPAKWDGNKGRGIFDPDPLFKAFVAPDVHRVSKSLYAWFTEKGDEYRTHQNKILISTGTTAEILSDWLADAITKVGTQVFIMEVDVTAYEANQTVEQNLESFGEMQRLGMRDSVYKKYCESNNLVFIDKPRDSIKKATLIAKTFVASRHGGNPSGLPDVTFRNTFNTLVGFCGCFLHHGFSVAEVLQCVASLFLGDDNFSLVPERFMQRLTPSSVREYFKEYHNWVVKVRFLPFSELPKAEFCSCYFASKSDGFVFTPKIGRVLSRTFFMRETLPKKPATMLGIVRGLSHFETGFIFSRVMRMLDDKLTSAGVIVDEHPPLWVDWSNNPMASSSKGKISSDETLEADCMRYDLSQREIYDVLNYIGGCIRESEFPRSPIFIPSHDLFDRICSVDIKIDDEDEMVSFVDESLPSRHLVRTVQSHLYYSAEHGVLNIMRRLRDSGTLLSFPARWGLGSPLRGAVT